MGDGQNLSAWFKAWVSLELETIFEMELHHARK